MAYIGNTPSFSVQRVSTEFTATAGQTTFSPSSGYTVGYIDVYLNGVRLISGVDYTATNGSTIVLTIAADLNDSVETVAYNPRGLTDGYNKSEADARYLLTSAGLSSFTTTNLAEGTNLYYTTARWDTRLATKSTDNLTEGPTNLYHTTARARAAVSVTDNGGDGSLSYNNSTGVITYNGPSPTEVRAHFSAGTGVTITNGQIAIAQAVGSGDSPSFTNMTLSGYLRGPATFTIDPATHGDNTGTVVIAGNLQVDGTTTTINSTTLLVDDLNITLADGAANAAAADGAGITVAGASATLTYNSTPDAWSFNKALGVGTNNPIYDLQVGTYGTDADSTLALASTTTGTGSIRFGDGTSGPQANAGRIYYDHTSDFMSLWTSATERLRITTDGISIDNTSPPTWDSTFKAMHIGTKATIASYSNSNIDIGVNWYYGVGGDKYIGNGYTTLYQQESGTHVWWTGANNTSGANASSSLNRAVTIDNSRNLLIGTSTASSGFSILVVNGNNTGAKSWNSGIQLNYGSGAFGGGSMTTANAAGGGLTFWTYTGNVGSETYARRVDINNNGNVGIGISSASARLQISNGDQTGTQLLVGESATFGAPSIRFVPATTNYMSLGFTTGSAAGDERIDSLNIQRTGNVGIGQNNPQTILHVTSTNQSIFLDNFGTDNHGLKLRYQTNSNHGFNFTYQPNDATCYIDSVYQSSPGTVYGDIYFRQNISGTMTTRLSIKASDGTIQANAPVELNGNRLRDTTGTARVFYNVTNAQDLYSNGSTAGAIVIDTTIPALTAGTMMHIKLCGYSYNSSQPWEMSIGVYSGESNFYSKGYVCLANPFDIIRLARKTSTSNMSIILGNGSGIYGTSVYVERVLLNFSTQSLSYATGWSYSRSTTLSGYDNIQTVDGAINNVAFKPTIPSSGTGAYSTDPNSLDDYEEGTWDPTPGGLTGISYNYRTGTYVKIGKIVHVFWDFSISSSSGTGTSALYGLPFTVSNDQAGYSVAQHRDSTIMTGGTGQVQLKGFAQKGDVYILNQYDYSGSSGFGTYANATYGNSGRHTGMCTYTTSL